MAPPPVRRAPFCGCRAENDSNDALVEGILAGEAPPPLRRAPGSCFENDPDLKLENGVLAGEAPPPARRSSEFCSEVSPLVKLVNGESWLRSCAACAWWAGRGQFCVHFG